MKARKMLILALPWGISYKTQWAWQGVKLTQLMSIFTSKKVWKFLIKIQLTKSDPKSTRRQKYPPSCQLGLSMYYIHSMFNTEKRTVEWGLLDKHANFVFWDNFPSVDKHKGQTWKAQGFCVLNPYLVIVSSIKANPVYLICKVKASAAKW